MNKKFIIAGISAFVLISAGGGFIYSKNHSSLKKTIDVKTGDFVMQNVRQSDIKTIYADTDEISLDLTGPADELSKINFDKIDKNAAEIGIPDGVTGISGTITLPNAMKLYDLDSPTADDTTTTGKTKTSLYAKANGSAGGSGGGGGSGGRSGAGSGGIGEGESEGEEDDEGAEGEGESEGEGEDPPTKPPTPPPPPPPNPICGDGTINQTYEECDDGNRRNWDGCSAVCRIEILPSVCGNSVIESLEECDDGNLINGDGCSAVCRIEIYKYSECTILIRQEERNQCCQTLNVNTLHDDCTGYWLFDYQTRLCFWYCPPQDCGLGGTQTERDECCAEENEDEPTPPCAGDWLYNNTEDMCEFECADFEGNDDLPSNDEIDETSQYCINTYTDENDKSECCDDFLKHPLSIGPRAGYPDCIGKWYLEKGSTKCAFQCSSYEEMLEIMKELKEQREEEE